jgi:hypothetical protein
VRSRAGSIPRAWSKSRRCRKRRSIVGQSVDLDVDLNLNFNTTLDIDLEGLLPRTRPSSASRLSCSRTSRPRLRSASAIGDVWNVVNDNVDGGGQVHVQVNVNAVDRA